LAVSIAAISKAILLLPFAWLVPTKRPSKQKIITRRIALRTALELAETAKTFLGLVLFMKNPPTKSASAISRSPPDLSAPIPER
jgi:hypothetical protein